MTNSAPEALPRHERPHRLDVLGAVLMIGATVALLLALTWGGVRYAWGSAADRSVLVGSRRCSGSPFAARLLTAPEPLIPLDGARQPGGALGTDRGLLRHGHVHRPDDLRADLFRDGGAACPPPIPAWR